MPSQFSPAPGAAGWQLSNPSVLDVIALNASLDTFRAARKILPSTMAGGHINGDAPVLASLREKSVDLTAYLELLLKADRHYLPPHELATAPAGDDAHFTIITPEDQSRRGAQLSLLFHPEDCMMPIFERLREGGVLGDERKPAVIRLAPVPMYNSWVDAYTAASELAKALNEYPGWVEEERAKVGLLQQARRRAAEVQRRVASGEDVGDASDSEPDEGLRRVASDVDGEAVDPYAARMIGSLSIGRSKDDELRQFNLDKARATGGINVTELERNSRTESRTV